MQKFRSNLQIRASQVRVIDEDGAQLGVLSFSEAMKIAGEKEMDLVEVSPNANPPVVKIVDLAKFRYQQQKAESQSKKKVKRVEVKTLRLSVRISEHDLTVRAKQAEKFLSDGHLVKVDLRMRGREQAFLDIAKEQIEKLPGLLSVPYKIDSPLKKMGPVLSLTLAPTSKPQ